MRLSLLTSATLALLLGAAPLAAQTTHTVTIVGNTFSPADLTIDEGDTVTWENNDTMFHNVNGSTAMYPSNPEGFSSGAVEAGPWTYSFTFNTVGDYGYHCDAHGNPDGGMRGFITVQSTVSTEGEAPDGLALEAAYPNPFRTSTGFSFTPEQAQHVRVAVYDLVGREVAVLLDEPVPGSAPSRITWAPRDLPAGIYVYQIDGETFQATRKVVLVR